METIDITQYYDDLIRLTLRKGNTQADAEDLVGETLLAAFALLHRGGTISHPKTWLTRTLCHKHHDNLRRKYRIPVTVCLEEGMEIASEPDESYLASQEAARVRKELNHLSFITREVLVRYYFGNQSVAEIAEGLQIPSGTVKSRLSAGRGQIKKGLEAMETRENCLPGEMYFSFGGMEGLHGEPTSLVEHDLIAQNLLILAYDKPLTVSELSRAIGIPAAYIEPIVKRLVDGELMAQTDSGKVYTDFIMTKPQTALASFQPQLAFAHRHFETVWCVIDEMSREISALPFVRTMEEAQRLRLDRYAVLKALQDFQLFGTGKLTLPSYPKRADGGWWYGQAVVFEAGYPMKAYREASEYAIHGGHRTSESLVEGGGLRVRLYEFDTTLWDSPHRYGFSYDLYFKHVIPLLWCIHTGQPFAENPDIPNELISHMPTLEELGLIGNAQGKPFLKIPVLKWEEYQTICARIKAATEKLKEAIGEAFAAFTASMKTPIPKHLTSVPELFRYQEATRYFVMAIVRKAYEDGLHLCGVAECCPPVVLSYTQSKP